MLDANNVLVKSFRMARDGIESSRCKEFKLRLIGSRNSDGRWYNLPTVSKVSGLIIGDIGPEKKYRDIIMRHKVEYCKE